MKDPPRRLWGIDVIAAVYGLATLVLVWLCFNGTPSGRMFGMILAPMCGVISLGILFRFNPIRIILMVLLGIAVFGDVLIALFYICAVVDLFQAPPNKEPLQELMRLPFRLALTLAMFLYLRRKDVGDAFRHKTRPKNAVSYVDVDRQT